MPNNHGRNFPEPAISFDLRPLKGTGKSAITIINAQVSVVSK
jgi:hypothetical protein